MKKFNIVLFVLTLALPLLVGIFSAALAANGMGAYAEMKKPPLSPPAWVFPVAWTILYILMGIASYCVISTEAIAKEKILALLLYGLQLVMNFMWSIIFFRWDMYLFAFIWLIIMWIIVIICAFRFYHINHIASYLLIPYIAWLTFAAYLNMGAYVLTDVL